MKINLFLENGYLDAKSIIDTGFPFIFINGGRGIGKTYNILKCLIELNKMFILMRRTQVQLDIVSTKEYNPFKKLADDCGYEIYANRTTRYSTTFYKKEGENEKELCYAMALSTFVNLRGFDASNVSTLFFDEYIKERHERSMKNESEAFINAYETINRNRELNNEKPLQCIFSGNSNDISSPLLMYFGLIEKCYELSEGNGFWYDKKKGVLLIQINDSPISKEKKKTALYKINEESNVSKMALENKFAYNDFGKIKNIPVIECKLICTIGELNIYLHKGSDEVYITTNKKSSGVDDKTLEVFRRKYLWIWIRFLNNEICFNSVNASIILQKYFKFI